MPTSVARIDLSPTAGVTSRPTYNDIVVFGRAEAEPDGGFNEATLYRSADDVAADHGDGSDVHVSSQALDEMGVSSWYVVIAEQNTTTETLDGSDSEPIDSGDLTETPVDPAYDITVTVDDTELTGDVYASLDPDAEDVATEDAALNYDTGYIRVGTASDGTGTGTQVDYGYVDWEPAFTAARQVGPDHVALADAPASKATVGDLASVEAFAQRVNSGVIGHLPSAIGRPVDDVLQEAWDVAGYLPSGSLMLTAHYADSVDVASHIAGQMATHNPWFDPMWDGDGYPFEVEGHFNDDDVGDPRTALTLEGGDADNNGPVNAIIEVGGDLMLSNSLTTVGDEESPYRYYDFGRTEAFISSEANDALVDLRKNTDKIPYTEDGRSKILGKIRGRIKQYARGTDAPLAEVNVDAPAIEELDEEDRNDRMFPGIKISGRLAGNVHEFGVELQVRV